MKSLVGNGKDFEFNSKINRKPRRTGVMWQNFGETVITRAAAF